MSDQYTNEPLLDMFIFETAQLLEQLEQSILSSEKECSYTLEAINEIFRIMHTIKGSSSMMMFNNISTLAHTIEDLFYYLRECSPEQVDYSYLSDLVLNGVDFIKSELEKIKINKEADGNSTPLITNLKDYLMVLKQNNDTGVSCEIQPLKDEKQQYYISQQKKEPILYKYSYKATIFFEDGCEMENIRAYAVIHDLKDITEEVYYIPDDIMESDDSIEVIRKDGFQIFFKSNYDYEYMHKQLIHTVFLKDLELIQLETEDEFKQFIKTKEIKLSDSTVSQSVKNTAVREKETGTKEGQVISTGQSIISVSVAKLDKLMDLVGEMVIAEAMVIQNPDLKGLILDNFQKSARQLSKITSEMQDMVMSIRMVPLSATFQKMHRIVRDMNKKLGKEVELEIIGEDTEVDKNIIEHISDPLMHLVRNALDHGIESLEERKQKGKQGNGTITLEAKNAGSDVLVIVKDNGSGLDKEKILQKAKENNLLYKDENEMTEKEIYNLILLPGFSTKESVTEFSGRGVGMDVVAKNIEMVGGSLVVDSGIDKGTVITLKIPLTLAIIDGMTIKVGKSYYTIPTNSIKESFRPMDKDLITDPDGNEMIMVRGQCYPILRLHERYKVKTDIVKFTEGIFIMAQQEEKRLCIFADELIGQQQVVVKSLPDYIVRYKKIKGLGGCTLLGDGSISLILDVTGLIQSK
ncbi:chemotaxis protein CheA [Anaerocolumna sedimenticola]|uniref:Chemotaxis protein CheA n=1 Tax=Anaerocolumna sedimenticola TaxID=2696063 RepID=A0A6P1TQJ6_9FIRM|nr:chemotaxis protein CheA [Anaerocolumna sedimenticola]QHQ62753.1 chemotaxis protein CheA [Anaerocolumna sedimenticola]